MTMGRNDYEDLVDIRPPGHMGSPLARVLLAALQLVDQRPISSERLGKSL